MPAVVAEIYAQTERTVSTNQVTIAMRARGHQASRANPVDVVLRGATKRIRTASGE